MEVGKLPNGYNGKILRVDLSRSAISVETPDENFYRRYLGGTGIVSYYLLREMKGTEDALSPENKLIFAPGIHTGLTVSGASRNSVGGKSPLTGGFGGAEVGGYWGAELKHAGWDAIVFDGKAPKPVYLSILDDKVEIKDASHLWGKTTGECEKIIHEELGDTGIRIASIGMAGENQVRFACVMNDLRHAAGRGGMGAVMGSKNLKAVAVRGTQKVGIADAAGFDAFMKWHTNSIQTGYGANFGKNGTRGVIKGFNATGNFPARNFTENTFEGWEKLCGETIDATILVRRESCWACSVRCKPVVATGAPYNVDPTYGGPEYEGIAAFGSDCGIDDVAAVCKANELSNAYGMDVISCGSTIAFAMDCFEKGIITEKDTGGIRLNFGNTEAMLQMVEKITRKEGFGKILAEGSARAAAVFGKGAENLAVHSRGQEYPMHDPRYKQGMGVGFAVSPTGAEHMANIHDPAFVTQVPPGNKTLGILDPIPLNDIGAAKVRILTYGTFQRHAYNALLQCYFAPLDFEKAVELVRHVTGWNMSFWELMKAGERCITMAHTFNVRAGKTIKDDFLARKSFTGATMGPIKGVAVNEAALTKAVSTYYDMMGWDKVTGEPTLAKLQELGIEWAAKKA
ncbi:MAG: aldehyde ferredoxin oxidoreductase family protein [Chloroflexi bacterium]|nr:aldehyde ferredoxin oxidoreductase family protein [Chloroflexota bacterium]